MRDYFFLKGEVLFVANAFEGALDDIVADAATASAALATITAGSDAVVTNFTGVKDLVDELSAFAALMKSGTFYAPVGAVVPFGGSVAPGGWLICNGASVARATYADLFDVIGTRYGSVDGSSFTLPSFNGRVPLGIASGSPTVPTTVTTSGTSLTTNNTTPTNHQHGGVSTGGGTTFGVDGGAGVLEHSHTISSHTHTVDAVQLLFIIKH